MSRRRKVRRPAFTVHTGPGGVWSLDAYPPCTGSEHRVLDSGPLSLLLGCISESDPMHDRVLLVWAELGNLRAWWCYACGAWGVER